MLSCRRGDDGGRYDKKQEGLVSITVDNNDYARLGARRALPLLLAPCDARGPLLGCVRDVSILALASLVTRCRRVASVDRLRSHTLLFNVAGLSLVTGQTLGSTGRIHLFLHAQRVAKSSVRNER